jgi:lon-related putative ATP-dependent protease
MKSKTRKRVSPSNGQPLRAKEVPVDQLRWRCEPKSLGIRTTDDVKPLKEIIGQDRALRALELGLEIKHYGYNIFVTGFSGTGRMTTLKRLLSEFQARPVKLYDRCYVNNFRNPDQPILLTLEAGQGVKFRDDMSDLIADLLKNIPAVFESRRYQEARKQTLEHFQERQRSVLKDFEKKVRERGFELIQVQVGQAVRPDIAPVINSTPVSAEQLDALLQQGKLTQENLEQLTKDRASLESQMEIVLKEMRNIERRAKESMNELAERFLLPLVKNRLDELRDRYKNERLLQYLDDVQNAIMEDAARFLPQEEAQPPIAGKSDRQGEADPFTEYRVNVILDNSLTKKVPIVIETNPRFKNLFGTIEREVDKNGVWRMDFTMIKNGSLLQADGGYLVLNALDTLIEPGVWQTLKRTLRNQLLEIQPLETGLFGAISALKPEPIPTHLKVVMIGDAFIYTLLYEQDDDFKKIFKVRADFDIEMPKDKTVQKYVSFIKALCDEEKLRPFDAEGVAEVVEYGVRLAGRQNKLSTRFDIVANVLREANYWAEKDNATTVTAEHVRKAIDERIERVKMIEDKIQELILEGTIFIDSSGQEIGQVNGLSVYDLGEYSFGKPSRITVRTAIGKAGVINIEREADLSGPTHNKGVLILAGYLRSMYATNKPLVMSASIAFEQSYSGVDGDSASSTEVYAILSSLAEIPLRQDIAVTGSVNQKGEIQPIGGVNQKVEGFYDVCKARGLTGTQGVLIPAQNIQHLMLRHDVVQAVERSKFHIYGISTIDEGIEVLTGIKAGKRLPNGKFESGSIHDRVDRKLTEYSKRWKEIGTE